LAVFLFQKNLEGGKKMALNIHSAKLNRELLKDIARGNLDISKNAVNLIIHLTAYVDRDGRIHLEESSLRKSMVLDRGSFKNAMRELCEIAYDGKKLVIKENGNYVSNFHVSTNGKESYLKYLPILTSPKFMNLTLNQTRLFLYIATLNVRNQYTAVAIENLYKNKLHDLRYGMNVYYSPQDMREDLFFLINNGFIFVYLPGQELHLTNANNYKKQFNDICGFKGDRKKRTSKYYKENHVIGLKVNPDIQKVDATVNDASNAELRLLCERYHMFHEDINKKTLNYITGKKNAMMEQFGKAGLSIYRTALENYFKEKHESIVYYDLLGKAANHFTDFYLLEEIKKVILAALKFELGSRGELAATGYSVSENNIPSLVKYFVANSSDEHKVLIDQDIQLIEKANDLMTGYVAKQPWSDLADSIEATFVKHIDKAELFFMEECLKNGLHNWRQLFAEIDSKELIVSLARESRLSKQRTMDEEAKELKQIVKFFRKKKIPLILEHIQKPPVEERRRKSNYNWLDL
jgi:hypothetical protein